MTNMYSSISLQRSERTNGSVSKAQASMKSWQGAKRSHPAWTSKGNYRAAKKPKSAVRKIAPGIENRQLVLTRRIGARLINNNAFFERIEISGNKKDLYFAGRCADAVHNGPDYFNAAMLPVIR